MNLPHARTIAARLRRSLTALGAVSPMPPEDGGTGLEGALAAVEDALEPFDEDPPQVEALAAADRVATLGRALVAALVAAGVAGERLGQSVRNLFECLGLAAEGAELSLRCGEAPDSPQR